MEESKEEPKDANKLESPDGSEIIASSKKEDTSDAVASGIDAGNDADPTALDADAGIDPVEVAKFRFFNTFIFSYYAMLGFLLVLLEIIIIGYGTVSTAWDGQDDFFSKIANYTPSMNITKPPVVYHSVPCELNDKACFQYYPMLSVQLSVMAVSAFLYIIGLLMTALLYPNIAGQPKKSLGSKIFLLLCEGEILLETCLLIFGWLFIFRNQGIASLRCLRIFRYFWYFEPAYQELPPHENPALYNFSASKFCLLIVDYMRRIGVELFTEASFGGAVVLSMYFFITYIMALVFWLQESYIMEALGHATQCHTLTNCVVTMIRLSMYDEDGFDYLTIQYDTYNFGNAFLLTVYMVCVSMVLLNGLIGIFGTALALDEQKEQARKEEKVQKVIQLKLEQGVTLPIPLDCVAARQVLLDLKTETEAMVTEVKADLKSRVERELLTTLRLKELKKLFKTMLPAAAVAKLSAKK